MRLEVDPGARADIAPDAVIGGDTRIHVRAGALTIGPGAVIGDDCVIVVHEAVEVGAQARLGDRVVLIDVGPTFADVERPIRTQPLRTAPIRVGAGAVIGPGAVLEGGADIAPGGRVGANVTVRPAT